MLTVQIRGGNKTNVNKLLVDARKYLAPLVRKLLTGKTLRLTMPAVLGDRSYRLNPVTGLIVDPVRPQSKWIRLGIGPTCPTTTDGCVDDGCLETFADNDCGSLNQSFEGASCPNQRKIDAR